MNNDRLHNPIGQQEMFKVPEGYFDKFQQQMSAQFAEMAQHEHSAKIRPLQYLYRVAACALVLAGLTCTLLWWNGGHDHEPLQADTQAEHATTVSEYGLDEVSDFAMLCNEDIYGYVEGEQ